MRNPGCIRAPKQPKADWKAPSAPSGENLPTEGRASGMMILRLAVPASLILGMLILSSGCVIPAYVIEAPATSVVLVRNDGRIREKIAGKAPMLELREYWPFFIPFNQSLFREAFNVNRQPRDNVAILGGYRVIDGFISGITFGLANASWTVKVYADVE